MRALLIASMLFVLAGGGAAGARASAPEPETRIDTARFYAGTWYEIGRRPMSLTNGCVAGGTTYSLGGDGAVTVLDFCHQGSPTGALRTIGGPARIVDPGSNAKLHVSYRFFGVFPIARDYWVLARADDYSWFISADPSFHDLWIYTRAPHPSPADIAALIARAKALGYDTSLLEFPATGS
jgi:apolipoprotein D and lipocalin family protein